MLDLLLKHREWEEERLKVQLMQGSNEIQINGDEYNHNLQQFVNSMEQYASLSANVQIQNIQNNLKTEFLNFKPLKDSSVVSTFLTFDFF